MGEYVEDSEPTYTDKSLRRKSIRDDLLKLQFSDEIKDRADDIHRQMGGETNRKGKRKLRILFCVCNAHIELGSPLPPDQVAEIMGMTRNDWQKAFSRFAYGPYHPPICEFPAQRYVNFLCKKIQLENQEHAKNIIRILNEVQDQNQDLLDRPPYTLASGAINYYLETNGIVIPGLPEKLGLSITTISNRTKEISRALSPNKRPPVE